jgi:hypothetical protein
VTISKDSSRCDQCDAWPVAVVELCTDSPHHGATICLECARAALTELESVSKELAK